MSSTCDASVTLTLAPLIDTGALVPMIVRASPIGAVAVTVKALPAGVEPESSAASNVIVSAAPCTAALTNLAVVLLMTDSSVNDPTSSPPARLFRRLAASAGRA